MLFTRVHTAFPRVARRKSGTAQGPTTGALLPGHIECDQVSRRSCTVTVRQIVPLQRVLPGCLCDILSPSTAYTSKKNPACMQARSRHAGTMHACSPEACMPGGAQNAVHIEKNASCRQENDACMHAGTMQVRCMHARHRHADTMHTCRHDACVRGGAEKAAGSSRAPLISRQWLLCGRTGPHCPHAHGEEPHPTHTQGHPKRSR